MEPVESVYPSKEGGQDLSQPLEAKTILLLGGLKETKPLKEMVVLDRSGSYSWIQLALKLPDKSMGGGAACLNGEIHIFGGFPGYKSTQKLDGNMKWTCLVDMNIGRTYITNSSVELNGSIWVLGGWDPKERQHLKSVERYDPKADKWMEMPEMKCSRSHAAATVWKGKIIVCGGISGQNDILNSMECFDPESGVWSMLNDLPTPLADHALVSDGSQLLLMGGSAVTYSCTGNVLKIENPLDEEEQWKPILPMRYPCWQFAGIAVGKEVFAIGGRQTSSELNRVEIFKGTRHRNGPSLPWNWVYPAAVAIPQYLAHRLQNIDKE